MNDSKIGGPIIGPIIGQDVVLRELESLYDLLQCLPSRTEIGAKALVDKASSIAADHGIKSLFKEFTSKAHETLHHLKVTYTCVDVAHDAIVLGTNLGLGILFDKMGRRIIRLLCPNRQEEVSCVKFLPTYNYVIAGQRDGCFTIFEFVLVSQGFGKPQKLSVCDAHSCTVTCAEWSPDSSMVYTGDEAGNIVATVVKLNEGILQSAVLFKEDSSLVQISYSSEDLLISTKKRTVLFNMKNRRLHRLEPKKGKYISPSLEKNALMKDERLTFQTSHWGLWSLFLSPARQGSHDVSTVVYARPGHRLWSADLQGRVSATMMFRDLLNRSPPPLLALERTPMSRGLSAKDISLSLRSFMDSLLLHGMKIMYGFLDPKNLKVLGCHNSQHQVLDVSTCGHEVFVLRQCAERFLIKFTLLPDISNPLLDVSTFAVAHTRDEVKPGERTENRQVKSASSSRNTCDSSSRRDNHHGLVPADVKSDIFSRKMPSQMNHVVQGVTNSIPSDAALNSPSPKDRPPGLGNKPASGSSIGRFPCVTLNGPLAVSENSVSVDRPLNITSNRPSNVSIDRAPDMTVNQTPDITMERPSNLTMSRFPNLLLERLSDVSNCRLNNSTEQEMPHGENKELLNEPCCSTAHQTQSLATSDVTQPPERYQAIITEEFPDIISNPENKRKKTKKKTHGDVLEDLEENCSASETMTPNSLDCSFRSIESADDKNIHRTMFHSKEKSFTTEEELNSETLIIDMMSVDTVESSSSMDIPSVHHEQSPSSSEDESFGDRECVATMETVSVTRVDYASDDNIESEIDESFQQGSSYNIYCSDPVPLSDMSFSDRSCDMSKIEGHRDHHLSLVQEEISASCDDSSETKCDGEADSTGDATPPLCVGQGGDLEMTPIIYWPRRASLDEDSSSEEDNVDNNRTSPSPPPESFTNSNQLRLLADSWADYAPPKCGSSQYLPLASAAQCLVVSHRLIWCVDHHDHVFYSHIQSHSLSWQKLEEEHANFIASNNEGTEVWSIDRKHLAYCRKGITSDCPEGTDWELVYKEVLYVAIDGSVVWIIKVNGDVVMITQHQPPKRSVQLIRKESDLIQLSCSEGLVWGIDRYNGIQMYKGISRASDSENNWSAVNGMRAKHVCLGKNGIAWIVDTSGAILFTDDLNPDNLDKTCYQVSLGQYLMQSVPFMTDQNTGHPTSSPYYLFSSAYNIVSQQVVQVPKVLTNKLEALWSWVKRGDEAKLITTTTSAGVWLLGSSGSIHASRGHLMGSNWSVVIPNGLTQASSWTHVSASALRHGVGHVWVLQPNGELFCFHPGERPMYVEPPKDVTLKFVSATQGALWGITSTQEVVLRIGITDSVPQGYSWMKLNVREQLGLEKFCFVSCGKLSVWAVDYRGHVWLRLGVSIKNTSGLSPVWIEAEGTAISRCQFTKVVVSPKDSIVWAVDNRGNVYARKDITPNFPIGTDWELIPGTTVRGLCISENMVWAICPNGDIACRYGVSENNCVGDYWKKVPGSGFEHISVTPDDELWAIDKNGQLFVRKTKQFYGAQFPFEPQLYERLLSSEDEWEVI